MKRLRPKDLANVVYSIPPDLAVKLIRAKGRLFLCGGFIRDIVRGEKPKDVDIFGTDADEIRQTGLSLGEERCRDFKPTVYAITVGPGKAPDGESVRYIRVPVQFVHTWPVSNPWTAITRMDFTMCQAAIWYKGGDWRSCITDQFYQDTEAKRLRYTYPDREGTAGRSLVRAMNFVKRGWTFPADEIAGLVSHTAHEVNTPDVKFTVTRRVKARGLFARNISGLYPIGSKA